MKRTFLQTLSVTVLLLLVYGTSVSTAQTLQGGLAFGTDSDLGVKVGVFVPVMESIDVGGDFTYFFPDGFDLYELNFNGRYAIPLEGSFGLFGIGGLNYTNVSVDTSSICGSFGVSCGNVSSSEIGVNIGAMAAFGSGPLGFYADAKFVLGGAEQLEFGGGVTFDL
jgi:hypothetical protein